MIATSRLYAACVSYNWFLTVGDLAQLRKRSVCCQRSLLCRPTFINGSLWVNWHERRIANGSGKNCWMPFLEQAPFGCFGARFEGWAENRDRKSTRLNSSHGYISYAVFCLKKKSFS